MSKRAEPLANQWWSQRFTAVLEGYGLGPRMERGRRYARGGRVQELLVKAGRLEARVQGSRATPYRVSVRSTAPSKAHPSKAQWKALEQAMAARLGWTAQLLNGEVPRDLEEPFAAVGVPLFPRRWSDLQVRCGCPDDAVPCKHIAAVLYVFAQRLDEDPWLLLAWPRPRPAAGRPAPRCPRTGQRRGPAALVARGPAGPPGAPPPAPRPAATRSTGAGAAALGPVGAAGDGRGGIGAAPSGVVPAVAGG